MPKNKHIKQKNTLSPTRFQRALIKGIGVDRYFNEQEMSRRVMLQSGGKVYDQDYDELERLTWYVGHPEGLEYFYKTHIKTVYYNSHPFWKSVNTNIPRVHYGLPRMISNTFGTLLFNQEPVISIDAGQIDRNEEYEHKIKLINELNDIVTLLQKAARLQSYSGGVALKLNYESSIADLPLITIYPKEKYEVHKKYGQIIQIDFYDQYELYTLVTSYGRGYITYKLFKEDKEVSKEILPQTAGLKDVVFIGEDDQLLNLMFAVVVDNPGEQSDYDGVISSFHALDEVYSSLINYLRKMKPHLFITEDVAPKDASGRILPFNDFDNIITILDGTPQGEATEVDRDSPKIDPAGYLQTIEAIQRSILSKVGLSPATIGLQDAGGNASAEALTIREWMTNRTREEKLAIWRERLNEFYYAALVFEVISKEAIDIEDGGTFKLPELPDFKVKINFGEFIKDSEESKIKKYAEAIKHKLIDIEYAVRKLWGDELSEDELQSMVVKIKIENKLI